MQIAVRLRRKARVHAAPVLIGFQIIQDDVPDEIRRAGLGGFRAGASFVGGFMVSFILQLLQHLDGLSDALEAGLASQHFQCFKQRRRDSSARRQRREWAGTSARFDFELAPRRAQRRFQAGMAEVASAKNLARLRPTPSAP